MSRGRRATAVVYGYHNVGARCLRVLAAHGVDVLRVVTHDDDPAETVWFERVADVARDLGVEAVVSADPNATSDVDAVRALGPDFLFSFYYRRMLSAAVLEVPARGALNMHGSLLPRYRGRAPVNWAVLHGERHTGASLHYMAVKPDAGDLVDQLAVPILPDDTARDVFDKVTVAAEIVLDRALPGLLAGTAPRMPLDLAAGSYFGGRTPEDGRIDWSWPARRIHDLVRAVAPPYPGAYTDTRGGRVRILRTRVVDDAAGSGSGDSVSRIAVRDGHVAVGCKGGGTLAILDADRAGSALSGATLADALRGAPALT